MRYFDKDGKEIDEKDAFDEKVIEIDDDGDPNAEQEEQVDPLTGERKVRKKGDGPAPGKKTSCC